MRWLMLASVLLVASSAWAQDQNSELVITLEGFDYGSGGQTFGVQQNVVVPDDLNPCLPVGDICGDPSIHTANGGDATDESGPFSFSATADGDYDFLNTSGTTWTDLEISFTLQGFELDPGEQFTCDGGNVFQNCGFMDPDNNVEVFFYDAFSGVGGGITSPVPEPSQWLTLSLACAALAAAILRKRAASSSS
jgi:hypothetical protein